MPQPQHSTALARWGSRRRTGREKLLFSVLGLLLVAAFAAVWIFAVNGIGDDRQELEDLLNSRHQETISVGIQQISGQTSETFVVDGVTRSDCNDTPDGYLECSDDPQPTPEGQ